MPASKPLMSRLKFSTGGGASSVTGGVLVTGETGGVGGLGGVFEEKFRITMDRQAKDRQTRSLDRANILRRTKDEKAGSCAEESPTGK